jgi:hypothetical protein
MAAEGKMENFLDIAHPNGDNTSTQHPRFDLPGCPPPMIRFTCPNCQKKLRAPESAAARIFRCPKCGQSQVVPPPVRSPDPILTEPEVLSPKSSSLAIPSYQGDLSPFDFDSQPEPIGHVHRVEHFHSGFIETRTRTETDAPGVISLIFGCIALLCMLLGCLTYGITCLVAVPFALIGAACGFGAKGNLRVAGLVLNLLVFIPVLVGVILLVAVVGITALGTSAKSEPSKNGNKEFERIGNKIGAAGS